MALCNIVGWVVAYEKKKNRKGTKKEGKKKKSKIREVINT